MISIGIDPGTRSTGLAIIEDGKVVEMAAARVKCPKGSTPRDRFYEMMNAVGEILLQWEEYEVERGALEWQHIRDGRKEKRPNNIVDLAHFGGGMLVLARANWPDSEWALPTPHDWKGDVEKAIHHERLKRKHPEVLGFGLNKTQLKDALDGAGLGLWVSAKFRV